MPIYIYRAMTKEGHIVKNRVEEISKSAIVKKIKRNGLMPISVIQLKTKTQKNKKNVKDVEQMLENLNNGNKIILAGFSEGADMCLRLLKDYIGNRKFYNS